MVKYLVRLGVIESEAIRNQLIRIPVDQNSG